MGRVPLQGLERHSREVSIEGGGDGTASAAVNQLWAWLLTFSKKIIHQQPILQLVGNSTLPLHRDFPDKATILISISMVFK